LLKHAYPKGRRLVRGSREDWLECVGLWVTQHQVGYDMQCLNGGGQT